MELLELQLMGLTLLQLFAKLIHITPERTAIREINACTLIPFSDSPSQTRQGIPFNFTILVVDSIVIFIICQFLNIYFFFQISATFSYFSYFAYFARNI